MSNKPGYHMPALTRLPYIESNGLNSSKAQALIWWQLINSDRRIIWISALWTQNKHQHEIHSFPMINST